VHDGEGRGLGLFGMEERAGYVGGRVEISSRPGKGTTVRASVPTAAGE
jgi:signal transduction histidine kinase